MKVKKYQEPSDTLPDSPEIPTASIMAVGPKGNKFYEDFINRYDADAATKDKLRNLIYNENMLCSDLYFDDDAQNWAGYYNPNTKRLHSKSDFSTNSVFDHELRHKITDLFPQSRKTTRMLKRAYPLSNVAHHYFNKTKWYLTPPQLIQNASFSNHERYSTNTELRGKISDRWGNIVGDRLNKKILELPDDTLFDYLRESGYTGSHDYLKRISKREAKDYYKRDFYGKIYDDVYKDLEINDPYVILPESVKNRDIFINQNMSKKLSKSMKHDFRNQYKNGKYKWQFDSEKLNNVRNALIKVAKFGGVI